MGNVINNVLHTNTAEYNDISNYQSLFNSVDDKQILNNIKRDKDKLIAKEKIFYKAVTGRNISTYEEFINEVNNMIEPKDYPFFLKFSNYEHDYASLYKDIMSQLQFSEQNFTTKKQQQQLQQLKDVGLVKNGKILSSATALEKFSGFVFKPKDISDTAATKFTIIFKTDSKYKSLKSGGFKFDLNQIMKEIKSDIVEEYTPQTFDLFVNTIESFLYSQRTQIAKELGIKSNELTVPYKTKIYEELRKYFFEQFNKINTNVSEIEFNTYYNWGYEASYAQVLKQDIEGNKLDTTFKKVKFIIDNMIQGSSDRFQKAVERSWTSYSSKFEKDMKEFKGQEVPGFLGEFAGSILLNYLSNKIDPSIVGSDLNFWGEPMRSDIRLNALGKQMGVQVKNFNENTIGLDFDSIDIKLHPYQILSRLPINLSSEAGMELTTLFANMSFNEDFYNQAEKNEGLLHYLSAYTANIANLLGEKYLTDKNISFLDVSPLWLIGGIFIVPGSMILEVLEERLLEKPVFYFTVQKSLLKTDEEWREKTAQSSTKEGTNIAAFAPYWKRTKVSENWYSTSKNKEEFTNRWRSKIISTHVKINPAHLLEKIQKYKLFIS